MQLPSRSVSFSVLIVLFSVSLLFGLWRTTNFVPHPQLKLMYKPVQGQDLRVAAETTQITDAAEQQWLELHTSLHVYSAHFHPFLRRVVLLGLSNFSAPQVTEINRRGLSCSLGQQLPRLHDVIDAKLWIETSFRKNYGSSFIICSREYNTTNLPAKFVTASLAINGSTYVLGKVLPVLYNPPKNMVEPSIAVCVKPFHHFYHHPERVREFIEVLHLFGADAFTIYNRSCSKNVTKLLRAYSKLGRKRGITLEVLNYPIPLSSESPQNPFKGYINAHDLGQMPTIFDCWLRNVYKYKYLFVIDVDEIPVLVNYSSYQDLIQKNPKVETFLFRHAQFPNSGADNPEIQRNSTLSGLKSLTLSKYMRYELPKDRTAHSKYLSLATAVRRPSVHSPVEHRPGFNGKLNRRVLEEYEGTVHHHRDGRTVPKDPVKDYSIMKYKERIARNLLQANQSIFSLR